MLSRIISFVTVILCCGTIVATTADESAFHFDYDQSDQTSAEAIASAKRAGAAQASADIVAGRFQIIEYGEPVDPPVPPVVPRDPGTGYSILSLHDCEPTPAFEAHVRAYNEAMRRWHSEHQTTTSKGDSATSDKKG